MLALLNGEFRSPPCTTFSRIQPLPTLRGGPAKLQGYGYEVVSRRLDSTNCGSLLVQRQGCPR